MGRPVFIWPFLRCLTLSPGVKLIKGWNLDEIMKGALTRSTSQPRRHRAPHQSVFFHWKKPNGRAAPQPCFPVFPRGPSASTKLQLGSNPPPTQNTPPQATAELLLPLSSTCWTTLPWRSLKHPLLLGNNTKTSRLLLLYKPHLLSLINQFCSQWANFDLKKKKDVCFTGLLSTVISGIIRLHLTCNYTFTHRAGLTLGGCILSIRQKTIGHTHTYTHTH